MTQPNRGPNRFPRQQEQFAWPKRGAFLTPDEKTKIADDHTVFMIVDMRKGSSKFGPVWHIDIDVEGALRTLTLADNEYRTTLLTAMFQHFANRGAAIPAVLGYYQTAGGQTAWEISPPNDNDSEDLPFD